MPLFRPVILRIFVSGLILKKMADDYLGRKMEEYLAREYGLTPARRMRLRRMYLE